MKKTVIAIWGEASQGKSSSIREIASSISVRFPGSSVNYLIQGNVDIKAIAQISGIKLGIESQGDPNSRLRQSLAEFVSDGCETIVCATRTRGDTVNAVLNFLQIMGMILSGHQICSVKKRILTISIQHLQTIFFQLLLTL